jgi:hypothetical protein
LLITRFLAATLLVAPPSVPEPSLFAKLAQASEQHDKKALLRLLSSRPLSTGRGTVGPDNDLKSGEIRYDVTATELAEKLQHCSVKRWNDGPDAWLGPFVFWSCPAERVPENPCWFYTYRASMFEPKDRPASLFVGAMPDRDVARCGAFTPRPPRWPGSER